MTKTIDNNGRNQQDACQNQSVPLSVPDRYERFHFITGTKLSQANFGSIDRSATIGSGRVSGPDAAIQFDSEPLYLIDMNIPGLVSPWSGRGPGADREFFGLNSHRPFGIQFKNISPADGDFLNRIGDHDTLIAKSDLRANQKNVNATNNKKGNQDANNFANSATLINTRPDEHRSYKYANGSVYQLGFRSISLNIGHVLILSHQASNKVKAAE